ncbi:MAG: hypothetical protein CML40_01530 [Rhodobacteraceae bacterium]|nr:MAG: hypothetical protein CML40_01530 [Paracoccaceae bacterium]
MAAKRSKISKTFAWVIVVILVLGLAGFGIQDVLRSSGRNEVASFGSQKISSDEYVRSIQQEIRALSQQLGTNLTFSQAKSIGVTQLALKKLISSAILDQTLEDLGISQSNSTLEKSIKSNAAFLDLAGRFSPEKYKDTLLNVNLQPNEYEEILRKELSRNLLINLMGSNLVMDGELRKLVLQFFLEERVANIITLSDKDIKEEISVTNSELQSFFESEQDLFVQPETKKISYIYLSPTDLVANQSVSEEEINQLFQSEKDLLNIPEKRHVDQIFFDSEIAATNALEIEKTKLLSFASIMKTRGLKKDDVSLGEITINNLPKDTQSKVFSVDKPGVIGPFKTELGFVVYRVNSISAPVVKTLADEYENLKARIGTTKATEELARIMTFVNDELAGGLTLEEIANSTQMEYGKLDFYAGANLPSLASSSSFKSAVRSAKNYASDVTFDDTGAIFSVRIDKTIEPFVKDFNDVRALVEEKALRKKIVATLEEKAALIIENTTKSGSSLMQISKSESYSLIEGKNYKRFDRPELVPRQLIEELFQMNKNELKVIGDTNNAFVLELSEVRPAALNTEEATLFNKQIEAEFVNSLEQDIFGALIDGLKTNHDLVISQKGIDAAIARFN